MIAIILGLIKHVIVQTFRGCTDLPHVGKHPGNAMLALFVLMGGVAGIGKGGLVGFIGGAGIMLLGIGPFYLYGAFSRAESSDMIESADIHLKRVFENDHL